MNDIVEDGADLKEKRKRDMELNDIRFLLNDARGRRVLWRLMENAKTFESVYHPSGSTTYYNSGRQDFGRFLMSEIMEADNAFSYFQKMMQENFEKIKKELSN